MSLGLQGKRVTVHLIVTGFRYTGEVLAENEGFLTLADEVNGQTYLFNMSEVSSVEVLRPRGEP